MTTSEVTRSDQRVEKWKLVPGFSSYEASDYSVWQIGEEPLIPPAPPRLIQVSGGIRSIDRVAGARRYKGTLLAGRLNSSGYTLINMTDDEGNKRTMLAHKVILLAHCGEPEPGQESLHNPERGPLWCRVPEDLRWGTRAENIADWKTNNGAAPKPQKLCVRCSCAFTGNGKRCHNCVVTIGEEATALLRSGETLARAAELLEYPSVDGLHTLAVKYGGYGVEPPSWSQKVKTTLRHIIPFRER